LSTAFSFALIFYKNILVHKAFYSEYLMEKCGQYRVEQQILERNGLVDG